MQDLTIILPTANRPEFLETALFSIESQTAIDTVKTVLVVENGLNRLSEKVCNKATNLPIEYIYNEPSLPVGYPSFLAILQRIKTTYTAMLCDDDWWFPYHLESTLSNLGKHENLIASYGGSLVTTGENANFTSAFGKSNLDFAMPGLENAFTCMLGTRELLLACTPSTCLHLSSMVANTNALLDAIEIINDGNMYDVDRLIPIALSRHGDIIINKYPTVAIRRHANQEGKRLKDYSKLRWRKTNEILSGLASAYCDKDLGELFNEHIDDKQDLQNLLQSCTFLSSADFLHEKGVAIKSPSPKTKQRLTSKILEQLTPPIILRLLRGVLSKS